MSNNQNKKIFLSYCWADKDFADVIDNHFRRIGVRIERDIRDLVDLADMKEYMRRIRDADYTIAIISPHYMASLNCMYEVKEFIKGLNYAEKLIPIVRKGFSVANLDTQKKCYDHWNLQDKELRQDVLKYPIESVAEKIKIIEEIKVYIFDFFKSITSKKYIAEHDIVHGNSIDNIFGFIGLEDTAFLTQLQKLYDIRNPEVREIKMLALANEYNVDESNVPFLFAKGYIADSDGKYELAISRYNQVIAIDETFSEAYFNLAILYDSIYGNQIKAIENYELAIKYDPNNIDAMNNLANIFVATERLKDAKKILDSALSISSTCHLTFHNLGIYFQRTGDTENAIKMYEKALELEPISPYTIDNYANLLIDVDNNIEQARELYKIAISEHPNEGDFYFNYAILITDYFPNEINEAEEYFVKAIELNPNDFEFHNSFAMRYWLPLERYDKVEEHLKTALVLNGESSHVLYNFGIFYDELVPDKQLSKEFYSKAIEPKDATEIVYAAAIESQYKNDCINESKATFLRGKRKFGADAFISSLDNLIPQSGIEELNSFYESTKRYLGLNELLINFLRLNDWNNWVVQAFAFNWDEDLYSSIKNDLLEQLPLNVPGTIHELDSLSLDLHQVVSKIVSFVEGVKNDEDKLFEGKPFLTTIEYSEYRSLFRSLATLLNKYKDITINLIDEMFCETIDDFSRPLVNDKSTPAWHI